MCAALLSPPLSAPPELKSLSPLLLTSLYPSSPHNPLLPVTGVASCAWVLGTQGPAPSVYASVFVQAHVCREGEMLTLFTLMTKYNL